MEFEVKSGAVTTPSLQGSSELSKQIAEMTKALTESTNSTKKNTKATEANTAAQNKFNISDLSRQAFDAAFNVKLRELTLGTI